MGHSQDQAHQSNCSANFKLCAELQAPGERPCRAGEYERATELTVTQPRNVWHGLEVIHPLWRRLFPSVAPNWRGSGLTSVYSSTSRNRSFRLHATHCDCTRKTPHTPTQLAHIPYPCLSIRQPRRVPRTHPCLRLGHALSHDNVTATSLPITPWSAHT